MSSRTLCVVLLPALVACSGSTLVDGAPDFGGGAAMPPAVPDLLVWPADTELNAWVQTVAPRIEAATGLRIAVGDGLPLFWSSRGEAEGWLGLMHVGGEGDWIAIDPAVPLALREAVVLHELLHALGAGHVGTGDGVLSPELWTRSKGWPITAADLERVCAVRQCTAFVPEVTTNTH